MAKQAMSSYVEQSVIAGQGRENYVCNSDVSQKNGVVANVEANASAVGEIAVKNTSCMTSTHNLDGLLEAALSLQTFECELTIEQKTRLISLLPGNTNEEKNRNLRDLFGGEIKQAFAPDCGKSGNPVSECIQKIKQNYFSPEQCLIRKFRNNANDAQCLLDRHEYYQSMLKDLMMRDWSAGPSKTISALKLEKTLTLSSNVREKVPDSCKKQYNAILNRVRRNTSVKFEEFQASSDTESDEEMEWRSNNKTNFDYKTILQNHKNNKKIKYEKLPIEMNTEKISLMDIVNRSFSGVKKASILKSSAINRKRRKASDPIIMKKKKLKLANASKSTATSQIKKKLAKNMKISNSQIANIISENQTTASNSASTKENLFSLIKEIIVTNSGIAVSKVAEIISSVVKTKLGKTQGSKQGDSGWTVLTEKALLFLSRSTADSGAFVDIDNDQHCTWIGSTDDATLHRLCDGWMNGTKQKPNETTEPKNQAEKLEESSPEEKAKFRAQERERYQKPHKAYTYKIKDHSYNVGPVKGMYHEGTIGSKPRGHVLLLNDRPSFVTILTLTRDAVARLPNAEGTRNDVCLLLRDSQYLKDNISDAQINSVVSGALDRLHYEKDPCVKYNAKLKLWFYLHGNRSIEELERIHATTGLENKNKRHLVDKPRKTTKAKQEINGVEKLTSFPTQGVPVNSPTNKPHVVQQWPVNPENLLTKPSVAATNKNDPRVKINDKVMQKPIRMTQQQFLEMTNQTRKISNQNTMTSKSMIVNVSKTNEMFKNLSQVNITSGNVVSTPSFKLMQNPNQKNVKLVLRPTTVAKPALLNYRTAEISNVQNKSPRLSQNSIRYVNSPQARPHTTPMLMQATQGSKVTQQQIQQEALRKLTQQLSAVSKRPVKIVHQSSLTEADTVTAAGAHVIDIGQGGELTLKMANHSSSSMQLISNKNARPHFSTPHNIVTDSTQATKKLIMLPGISKRTPAKPVIIASQNIHNNASSSNNFTTKTNFNNNQLNMKHGSTLSNAVTSSLPVSMTTQPTIIVRKVKSVSAPSNPVARAVLTSESPSINPD